MFRYKDKFTRIYISFLKSQILFIYFHFYHIFPFLSKLIFKEYGVIKDIKSKNKTKENNEPLLFPLLPIKFTHEF